MGMTSSSKTDKGKNRLAKLSNNERRVLDYLAAEKDDPTNIKKMAKHLGISRPTVYACLAKFKKESIVFPQWKINYNNLGFMVVFAEIRVVKGSEKDAIIRLKKMPSILGIKRNLNGRLMIEIIIKEMDDHFGLIEQLRKIGIELEDYTIYIEELFP